MRKQVIIVFAACLALYGALFALDSHLRLRRGPWKLTFAPGNDGNPELELAQPGLAISNVVLVVKGETLTNAASFFERTVIFDRPGFSVPFGRVLFEDFTYLPGTISLDLMGHEVELLPRVLTVDRREYPWRPGLRIELLPEHKPKPRELKKR